MSEAKDLGSVITEYESVRDHFIKVRKAMKTAGYKNIVAEDTKKYFLEKKKKKKKANSTQPAVGKVEKKKKKREKKKSSKD
jgi:hypothetical protein